MDGCEKCIYKTKEPRFFLTRSSNFHENCLLAFLFWVECSSSLGSAASSLKWPLVIFLLDRSEQPCSNQKGSVLPPQVNGYSGLIGDILKANTATAVLGHLDNLMPVLR